MSFHCFVSSPARALKDEMTVPGDKSISHRAIILGAIAQGITVIEGFLEGEDCLATLKAFRAMGVRIEGPVSGRVVIHGAGKHGLKKPASAIDCGNSGTSMRLLAGLLAAQNFDSELTGDASLQRRPMERIRVPLSRMGADIRTSEGRPPLYITGGQSLKGICYQMPEASAQVKSCVLLAGLYAEGETRIIEPGPARNHTENMLKSFGYPVETKANEIALHNEGEFSGTNITVPGDISSAAFFIVAATLIPGSCLYIRNVGVNPTRTGVIEILKRMGAKITLENPRRYGGENVADLKVEHAPLKGITIPEELVPLAIDEFPVIFIAAACAKGETILHGARELRCKESDRIAAMVNGLQQLGINAHALDDGAIIQGGIVQGGTVDSQKDHRIAMAFAIAGAVAASDVLIQDCASVATSFPTFVKTANDINLVIKELHHDIQ